MRKKQGAKNFLLHSLFLAFLCLNCPWRIYMYHNFGTFPSYLSIFCTLFLDISQQTSFISFPSLSCVPLNQFPFHFYSIFLTSYLFSVIPLFFIFLFNFPNFFLLNIIEVSCSETVTHSGSASGHLPLLACFPSDMCYV